MTESRIEVDSIVNDLLEKHPALILTEGGRIRCTLTNHEIVAKEKAITQHVNGKKYKRLTKDLEKSFDFNQFPHIVASTKKGHENHMFCQLTLKHLNKVPQHIMKHVNGKKYKKARIRWDKCQVSGLKFVPTPMLNRTPVSEGGMVKSEAKVAADEESAEEENDEDYESFEEEEVSDADSFSDLYPAEYFERLQISEPEATDMEVAKKAKKKKAPKKKVPISKSDKKVVAKRKTVTKSQEVSMKKPKISKKSSKAQLLTFA